MVGAALAPPWGAARCRRRDRSWAQGTGFPPLRGPHRAPRAPSAWIQQPANAWVPPACAELIAVRWDGLCTMRPVVRCPAGTSIGSMDVFPSPPSAVVLSSRPAGSAAAPGKAVAWAAPPKMRSPRSGNVLFAQRSEVANEGQQICTCLPRGSGAPLDRSGAGSGNGPHCPGSCSSCRSNAPRGPANPRARSPGTGGAADALEAQHERQFFDPRKVRGCPDPAWPVMRVQAAHPAPFRLRRLVHGFCTRGG